LVSDATLNKVGPTKELDRYPRFVTPENKENKTGKTHNHSKSAKKKLFTPNSKAQLFSPPNLEPNSSSNSTMKSDPANPLITPNGKISTIEKSQIHGTPVRKKKLFTPSSQPQAFSPNNLEPENCSKSKTKYHLKLKK